MDLVVFVDILPIFTPGLPLVVLIKNDNFWVVASLPFANHESKELFSRDLVDLKVRQYVYFSFPLILVRVVDAHFEE